MQKITPFIWFDRNAEAAVDFYASVFPDFKLGRVLRHGDAGPGPKGQVVTIEFELFGQTYTALNGEPFFQLTPAVSFVVHCQSQEEVDHYWDRLAEGGNAMQCGWVTDRFGVTWQVIPDVLLQLLLSEDAAKAQRVTDAMMEMQKIDVPTLLRAAEEPEPVA
jgi:predicted 3-demethylubiquinone-9 3-methyltransferase (glyoxalase superfamily)